MKKIAIISDIHANLPALEAVLNDIQTNYTTEDIYCLGDLVDAAPWHNEVIELIEARGIPTVMGNHDERIVLNSQVIPMANTLLRRLRHVLPQLNTPRHLSPMRQEPF